MALSNDDFVPPGRRSATPANHEPIRRRAFGAPLPVGGGGYAAEGETGYGRPRESVYGQPQEMPRQHFEEESVPEAQAESESGREAQAREGGVPAGVQRFLSAALPLVQKLLPLFDGHVATTVSNLMTPSAPAAPKPQQAAVHQPVVVRAPQVDLVPIEEGIHELQVQHGELRERIIEQNASIKRVEDQLDLVREATDRNTLEQQELFEDLKSVGMKVNVIALVLLVLLIASVTINVLLFMHLNRVLP